MPLLLLPLPRRGLLRLLPLRRRLLRRRLLLYRGYRGRRLRLLFAGPQFPVQRQRLAVFVEDVHLVASLEPFRQVQLLARAVHEAHPDLDRGVFVRPRRDGLADVAAAFFDLDGDLVRLYGHGLAAADHLLQFFLLFPGRLHGLLLREGNVFVIPPAEACRYAD
ncbi:hypothetical protein [Moorella sp. E308F]|uniref:hypothetical protein n=1 Tax=Moorella sp. E308F TaxID=2572682 RepID=UPI001C0EFD36|nr:hypothetical protein [Moorella sp. E308F]